ncbi:mechanosensitive ion channel family protein [Kiritimatiellaeota bacterium B1221]|nr:mechanosensitive ion channel family protein [Kiritimatiellaeota bacterium B1221]
MSIAFVVPEWLSWDVVPINWWRGVLIAVVGWPLLHLSAVLLRKTLKKHATPQASMLGYKIVSYGGGLIIILTVLAELGFKISTFLGAAGIMGVAVGFASQTSLSNLISGIFLVWEKPFAVDDVIRVNGNTGVVHEIDLLATKIRTFDNTLIRIPNENMIKSEVTNITKYQIRRFDINLGVAYKEDVGKVIKILQAVADKNPWCLDEPAPIVLFLGFGDSSLNFLFGVWFAKADFVSLRNSIQREILERFREEDIEIPFPHLSLYTGSVTEPFPIEIKNSGSGAVPAPE